MELRDPPQPNFSVNARSVDKLLLQVDQWHNELAQQIIAHEENGRPISDDKMLSDLLYSRRIICQVLEQTHLLAQR